MALTARSTLWHRATKLIPGGVNSPVRAMRSVGLDEPVFVRSGGSIPVVADLAAAGIPTIVSGFSLPDDAFHAPDESYRLKSVELGEAAARELLHALARL